MRADLHPVGGLDEARVAEAAGRHQHPLALRTAAAHDAPGGQLGEEPARRRPGKVGVVEGPVPVNGQRFGGPWFGGRGSVARGSVARGSMISGGAFSPADSSMSRPLQ